MPDERKLVSTKPAAAQFAFENRLFYPRFTIGQIYVTYVIYANRVNGGNDD